MSAVRRDSKASASLLAAAAAAAGAGPSSSSSSSSPQGFASGGGGGGIYFSSPPSSSSSSPAGAFASSSPGAANFAASMSLVADPTTGDDRVLVAIRARGMLPHEVARKDKACVGMSTKRGAVYVDGEPQGFAADFALWSGDGNDKDGAEPLSQKQVYEVIGRPMVENICDGYSACIIAYGQTSSGKTHTMTGDTDFPHLGRNLTMEMLPAEAGLMPRMAIDLFARLKEAERASCGEIRWTVSVSYIEVYLERVTDLLYGMKNSKAEFSDIRAQNPNQHPGSCVVREDADGKFIPVGNNKVPVQSLDEVLSAFKYGNMLRHTAATNMNAHSSRSHALFYMHMTETLALSLPDGTTATALSKQVTLKLVDLAGSERLDETGATGERLSEAKKINGSLSCLGNIIDALASKKKHVPYRDSILTKLLRDTFGGNSKTLMVATVAPSEQFKGQTVGTLNYATRARKIQNTAVIIEDPQAAELRRKNEELDRVRRELADAHAKLNNGVMSDADRERARKLQEDLDAAQRRIHEDQEEARRREEIIQRKQRELEAMVANSASLEAKWQSQIEALELAKREAGRSLEQTEAELLQAQSNAQRAAELLKRKEAELEKKFSELDAKAASRLAELETETRKREAALQKAAEEAEKKAKAALVAKAEEAALRERELAQKVAEAEEAAERKRDELARIEAASREREKELLAHAAALGAEAQRREQEAAARAQQLEQQAAAAAALAKQREEELAASMAAATQAAERNAEKKRQELAKLETEAKEREAQLVARAAALEKASQEQAARTRELEVAAAAAAALAKKREEELAASMAAAAEAAEKVAAKKRDELAKLEAEAKEREAQLVARASSLEHAAAKKEQDLMDRLRVMEAEALQKQRALEQQTGERERELQAAAFEAESLARKREQELAAAAALAKRRDADFEAKAAAARDAEAKAKQREHDLAQRALAAEHAAQQKESDYSSRMKQLQDQAAAREAALKEMQSSVEREKAAYEQRLRSFEQQAAQERANLAGKMSELERREKEVKAQLASLDNDRKKREAELGQAMSSLEERRQRGYQSSQSLTDELLSRIKVLEIENTQLRSGVKNCARCTVEMPLSATRCSLCGHPANGPAAAPPQQPAVFFVAGGGGAGGAGGSARGRSPPADVGHSSGSRGLFGM